MHKLDAQRHARIIAQNLYIGGEGVLLSLHQSEVKIAEYIFPRYGIKSRRVDGHGQFNTIFIFFRRRAMYRNYMK